MGSAQPELRVHALPVADLLLISRTRVDPLSDAETFRLGRALVAVSGRSHVSFPDGTPTTVAVVHQYEGQMSVAARRRVADILGEFDERLTDSGA